MTPNPFSSPIIVCRPALPSDKADVLEFTKFIWDGHDYIRYVWDEWLADAQGMLAVAQYEGHCVGLGKISLSAPGQWWLQGLRVDPKFQDLKIGSHIHAYLDAWWLEHGSGVVRLMTSSKRVKVHHLCEKLRYAKVLEVKEFEAGSLNEACANFQAVQTEEIPAALKIALHSPVLALGRGLFDQGWDALEPTEETVAEIQQQGMAYWWRDKEGLLLGWDDDNEDGKVLGLGLPACSLESLPELLLDARRLAAQQGTGRRVLDRAAQTRNPVRGGGCRLRAARGALGVSVRKTPSRPAMKLDLPPQFIQTIQNTFGEDGQRWLKSFPALIGEAIRRWGLTEIQPVSNLSYNFVAFATKPPSRAPVSGGEASFVLKLGIPNRELRSEIAALKAYAGRGACRLLDADAEKGMLLLERLQPGRMLAALEDDERATRIAADVIKNLWERCNDLGHFSDMASREFIRLKDWFDGFQRLRKRFNGGTGPLPKGLVESAEALSRELLSENKDEALLHGDFHHFNVLESARGWLAIDPKGVIGPRGYEVGPFLINPVPGFLNGNNPRVRTERRIAILSEMLGLEKERIRAWGFCHAVLSAWWSIEDNDPGWGEYSLRCAEIFRQGLG